MAVLSTEERKAIPSSKFALRKKRMFPLTDKEHDRKAIQLAPYSESKGNITQAEEAHVVNEAKRKLRAGKRMMKGKK